jgi:PAS domain S-box-containing protein
LRDEGYEVLGASDGNECLTVIGNARPDLVLLDVMLPDMGGIEVCRRIKADHSLGRAFVVLVASDGSASESQAEALEREADGYILGPIPDKELLARVRTLVRVKRAEDETKRVSEEWEATFNSLTDPVSIHDKDFRLIKVNKAFSEMLGMTPGEIVGKKCHSLLHGSEDPWPGCPHRQAMASRKPVTEEFWEPRLGKCVLVSVSPLFDNVEELVGSVHTVKDITKRKQAEEALERAHDELERRVRERTADLARANAELVRKEEILAERLRFEGLLVDISARFVNLSSDQIDGEIEDAQRQICELLDIDRSTLWQVSEGEPETLLLTHYHQPPGSLSPPERMSLNKFWPWSLQKVLAGETLAISNMTDLPAEADRDRENFGLYGTRSVVVVPLSVGTRKVFGVLTFAVMREERNWPETIVKGFQLIAQVFTNAFARKAADEALRESEARLRLSTDAAGVGLWIMEPGTGHLWVTPKTRELFHFAPEEGLNHESLFKGIHPEDRDRLKQAVQQALQAGESLRSEYRIVLPDGDIRWMVSRGQWHLGSAGESDRLMGVSLDITERKRAEHALEERLRFERLLTDLLGRFATISSEQVDMEISGALKKLLEFFQADRIGLLTYSGDRTSWQITHAAFVEGIRPLPLQDDLPKSLFPWVFGKIFDQNEVVSARAIQDLPEEARVDKESLRKWGIRSFLNIPIISGGIVHCVTITTDRSELDWPKEYIPRMQLIGNVLFNAVERKKMGESIRRAAQEWQTTFDSIPDIIMILDRDLRILRHNAAAVSFFNLPPQEIIGRHCHHLMHGAKEPPLDCPAKKSLSMREHQENEIYDAERNAWFLISSDPITDWEGQITQIVHRIKDITSQKTAEVEKLAVRRELQRSERLLRMGELTASLAHELNQPLTSILSNARAALRFIETDRLDVEELKEILEDIANDDQRAGEIIRSLRSMFRQEQGEREPVAINPLVREVISLLRGEAVMRNLQVELEFADRLPPVTINKIQVQQVVINLMMNAAESIPDASRERTITIRTRRSDKGHVQVAVCDTGSGMDEKDLVRIFEPFFTGKRSGLGMGLSISRSIIETHGGRIWARNNPDKGATFFFDLPVTEDE